MAIELSVIIPLYNGGKYIKKTLNNILSVNASLFEFEIIVINDGSTDNSEDCVLSVMKDCRIIRYFKKENGGIASARNYGLHKARGKYISFVDQDDYLKKPYFQFLQLCEKFNSDVLISNPYYDNGKTIYKKNYIIQDEELSSSQSTTKKSIFAIAKNLICSQIFKTEATQNKIPPSLWNCIFKRNVILENKIHIIQRVDYEDDWLFVLSFLSCSNSIYFSSEGFYCWRINQESTSHSKRYIDNFYAKRKNLKSDILNLLNKMNSTEDEINRFLHEIYNPNTLLFLLFNETSIKQNIYSIKSKINCAVDMEKIKIT